MMQLAKLVGEIAVGDAPEQSDPLPDERAVKRGKARAEQLGASKRKAIAKKAAKARWESRRAK